MVQLVLIKNFQNIPVPNSKENLKSPRVANPDAWARLIGPHNIAPLKVENFETNALLGSGSMVSTISESWVKELGLPLFPLEPLLPIQQAGGLTWTI